MRAFRMLLAAAAFSTAGTAIAADVPKAVDDKRICKTERSVSSRIVRQTCKTAAEWRQESLDARNKLKLGAKSQTTEAFKPPAGQ